MNTLRALMGLGCLLLMGTTTHALAQPGASQSVTYPVSAVDGSGVDGVVTLADFGADTTVVVVSLQGLSADGVHPAHLHAGDCGSGGGIVVPLADVEGADGLGVSLVATPFADIVDGDHYLNVHLSPENLGVIVACGEVGQGAEASAGAVSAERAEGQADAEPARPEEFDELRTASFGVFPVEGSGVNGVLQVTEQQEGGLRLVMSLTGIERGERYPVAVYAGDCGPDRELVLELEPVGGGSIPNDPFASLTEPELSFDELTGGDFFLYVFEAGDAVDRPADFGLDVPALACGELGAGASR